MLVTGTPNVLGILADRFGCTVNAKGYKVLNPHVRLIQSDGVNYEMLDYLLYTMQEAGFSADNIAFGSGLRAVAAVEPRHAGIRLQSQSFFRAGTPAKFQRGEQFGESFAIEDHAAENRVDERLQCFGRQAVLLGLFRQARRRASRP